MEKLVYSIQEAANLLGVARPTIYKEINDGRLKSVKIRNRRLIVKSDLEEYLKSKSIDYSEAS